MTYGSGGDGGLREDSALPTLADDQARADLLRHRALRVEHAWTDGRLTSASLLDSDGHRVASIDRVAAAKPPARFIWILGDFRSCRWFVRDVDGLLLWEVLRKPNAGGTKADMAPVPEAAVVRATRGMPWSKTDFTLYARTGHRIGSVRWARGLFSPDRVVADPALRPVLETYDHGRGPWADYSVRWVAGVDDVPEPLRTAGFVSLLCSNTALTKVRN